MTHEKIRGYLWAFLNSQRVVSPTVTKRAGRQEGQVGRERRQSEFVHQWTMGKRQSIRAGVWGCVQKHWTTQCLSKQHCFHSQKHLFGFTCALQSVSRSPCEDERQWNKTCWEPMKKPDSHVLTKVWGRSPCEEERRRSETCWRMNVDECSCENCHSHWSEPWCTESTRAHIPVCLHCAHTHTSTLPSPQSNSYIQMRENEMKGKSKD